VAAAAVAEEVVAVVDVSKVTIETPAHRKMVQS
jgi:hypothetical protein